MSDAPELKPCPFCGETVAINDYTKAPAMAWVMIHRCKIIGPIKMNGWSRDSVVTEWNTRADQHRAEVEAAVKRAIEACADEVDCGGCYGQCQDPANCSAKEAAAIRALASDPAALERIINGGGE